MSEKFIRQSLETHLFFARIMKEHSLFLMAGFPAVNADYIKRADWFRAQFEELLSEVVEVSSAVVSQEILESGEIVTEFTLQAEKSTGRLTGIPIDSRITEAEMRLQSGCMVKVTRERIQRTQRINNKALRLTRGLIAFKENIRKNVAACQLFTSNYPLLIEHILREARLYQSTVQELNQRGGLSRQSLQNLEVFWNQIMMEHALFIRGLLDPTEAELIETADDFAGEYGKLLKEAREREDCTLDELTRRTLEETERYRDFKAAGARGIAECRISSIILPLLADHVLREANHYLRILEEGVEENRGESDRRESNRRESNRRECDCSREWRR